jgi:hypothetical protein
VREKKKMRRRKRKRQTDTDTELKRASGTEELTHNIHVGER